MSIESVMPSNHLILCRPFSSGLLFFPASGSFPMRLFTSNGQSIAASASESVIPMNNEDCFPLRERVLFQGASLVAQRLKCLPGMRETQVQSLGREDPLEKEMATHSSTLAWRIPWREEPGRLQSTGSQRVGQDWATSLSLSFKVDWFDLLAVQGTLKSLLQYHNLKTSILWCSAFFMVQLSQPYYWKNHSFDYMDLHRLSNVSAF